MSGAAAADRTPIKLGVVGTDVGAIAAVFGKPGIDWTTSPKKVVDHINKSGGVGGRQLVPTFFGADSAADNATNGQKACSAMTEDNNIDVVVNVGMLGDVLPACLKQRGVAMFDAASWYADATVMDQFPNWVIPNAIRLDRSAGALMQTAVSRGFMKRGAKLGVIVEGCPWGQRVYNGTVVPLAQRSGVTVVEGSTKCITNLVADLVPVQNDVQREALRLKTLGATHVMVLSQAEAFVFAQFTGQASQQRYFPKYLVSSQAYPTQNSTEGAVIAISADARANVLGVGTMPYLDTGDAAAVVRGAQVSRDRCSKADPERQQAETNAFALNNFYGMCDTFYAMKLAIEASGLHTGAADVVRGWAAVLQRKASSSILAGGVWSGSGAGRLDGAGYARPFAYDTGKKRFAYVGAAVAVP